MKDTKKDLLDKWNELDKVKSQNRKNEKKLKLSIKSEIDKEKNKYKVKIGQKFILEKDTLTIIDYSSIMETFTLSNGKEVNTSIVFNKDSVSVK